MIHRNTLVEHPSPRMRITPLLSATLDAMLVRGKSIVTPSWEAKADIHIEPVKWFRMDLIAANYRIPYTYEQIRFLSDDYMNGEVYKDCRGSTSMDAVTARETC